MSAVPQSRDRGDVIRRAVEVPVPEVAVPIVVKRRVSRAKRLLDIFGASIGLILLSPVAAAAGLAVKATSRGPVLFRQIRVSQNGAEFELIKFRTMRDGTHAAVLADASARAAYEENDYKLPQDDPSITAVGRILRKTSLDELPQLVNVLRGEMSIVGIRPLLAGELAQRPAYDQALYRMMKPGLTGLWQVQGRSTVGKADRLGLDRAYVENWSMMGDLRIIVRTPLALLRVSHAH